MVVRRFSASHLAIDQDYNNTAVLPPAGQSALWKYMAIYRQADEPVGKWSDVVSIAVAAGVLSAAVSKIKLFRISSKL